MTEPTLDERIEKLRTTWQFGNGPGYLEALAIIDELREDVKSEQIACRLHEDTIDELKKQLRSADRGALRLADAIRGVGDD